MEIELSDLVERKYTGSWFCMEEGGLPSDQRSVVETRRGGPQGRTCGGIIFLMLYAKATREVPCARRENLSFTLPFDPVGDDVGCSCEYTCRSQRKA